MQFYFIRHAQSENNLLWAQTGSEVGRDEDPELTALGRQQAERLAQFLREARRPAAASEEPYDFQNLRGFALTHLYCSLMVRAVSTGMVVAQALDLPLVGWEDLHEVGGIHQEDASTGECLGLPGKNRSYFETHYAGLLLPESVGEAGWWNRPFEEFGQRSIRARRFLSTLLDCHDHGDDRVAVISHGGFFNHLMRAILNLPDEGHYSFTMNNTAITRIDFNDGWIRLRYLNRLDFLPAEWIT